MRRLGRRNAFSRYLFLAIAGLAAACVPGVDGSADLPLPGGSAASAPGRGPLGPSPEFGSAVSAAVPPPPITGGTLRVLADGRTAVAADPDRDLIYVVDLRGRRVLETVRLERGDEPGRVEQDGDGRVHVALRRGGALVTLAPPAWKMIARRTVCPAPRGVAYDKTRDLLHVACAGGELVSLAPAPPAEGTGQVQRRLLDKDLRDVVVRGDRLLISRFKSAELLEVNAEGAVSRRTTLPSARGFISGENRTKGTATFEPGVAWRVIPLGEKSVVVLHQRALADEVSTEPGGYGGSFCGGIAQAVVTPVENSGVAPQPTAALSIPALAVDIDYSPERDKLALVVPANAHSPHQPTLVVARRESLMAPGDCVGVPNEVHPSGFVEKPSVPVPVDAGVAQTDARVQTDAEVPDPDAGGAQADAGGPPSGLDEDPLDGEPIEYRAPTGEPVAVAFLPRGHLLVQTREPATLQIVSARATIVLSNESRADTGHAIFHANASSGIACASCHPEGGEDGRVWRFQDIGGRRTQSLRGGLLATEPFHWDGSLPNLGHLMAEVFVGRMQGPKISDLHLQTLSRWMDRIALVPASAPRDPAAVARGQALFESPAVGCAACHTGKMLTNNQTVHVGTGPAMQVPSLLGIGHRAPFMHNGCAKTLGARFEPECGGGDLHGVTSKLTPQQIDDLVSYMETL
jgi:mono/diheme cytochrome c family protein